jgi:hypothetical protein
LPRRRGTRNSAIRPGLRPAVTRLRRGHRFADAADVQEIFEHGVVLKLDRAACEQLQKPTANPAVMHDDPAESNSEFSHAKLRRAWDLISGNY